jgi:hypothetical protein
MPLPIVEPVRRVPRAYSPPVFIILLAFQRGRAKWGSKSEV